MESVRVALRIFSFLDVVTLCRCAQVSRAWNVLALDGSNWQRIDLFDFQRDIEFRILEVARCSQLTDNGFTTLARNCHELEKMDLEECVQITDATLVQLSLYCPRIQVLSLSHCELLTDEGIRHLGNSACAHDRLEVIELDNCPLITDASLEHLKSCHSLERIELYDCQQITRAGIKRLRTHLPNIKVHAYFAPVTPPPSVGGSRQRFCRCCIIL
nr:PREDICTED: F-box/LRR-repeat protein 20 [Latimeria chalumnae]|eukprot:XP_014345653.1 PREDICTED: F-box/LRR-repeat protein 20 [Latimeria chalumnae]